MEERKSKKKYSNGKVLLIFSISGFVAGLLFNIPTVMDIINSPIKKAEDASIDLYIRNLVLFTVLFMFIAILVILFRKDKAVLECAKQKNLTFGIQKKPAMLLISMVICTLIIVCVLVSSISVTNKYTEKLIACEQHKHTEECSKTTDGTILIPMSEYDRWQTESELKYENYHDFANFYFYYNFRQGTFSTEVTCEILNEHRWNPSYNFVSGRIQSIHNGQMKRHLYIIIIPIIALISTLITFLIKNRKITVVENGICTKSSSDEPNIPFKSVCCVSKKKNTLTIKTVQKKISIYHLTNCDEIYNCIKSQMGENPKLQFAKPQITDILD